MREGGTDPAEVTVCVCERESVCVSVWCEEWATSGEDHPTF